MKNLNKLKEMALLFIVLAIAMGGVFILGREMFAKTEIIEVEVEKPEEPIEDTVKRVCEEEKVPVHICIIVAWEESYFNPYFTNKMTDKSLDRGIMSINNVHFKPYVPDTCAYSVECSMRVFAKAYKERKAYLWLVYPNIKNRLDK